jgi:hypothetical protein
VSAEGVLASDADRDAAASALAESVAAGQLSLAEHNARLDALFAARTVDQVAAVTADLSASGQSALPVRRGALYRAVDPYRLVAVGGSVRRAGRFPIGRFCGVTAVCATVDLDLRSAVPAQREITLTVRGVAARVAITVPASWSVSDQVLVLGSRRAIADREGEPGGVVLRLRGACLGGTYRLTLGRLGGALRRRALTYRDDDRGRACAFHQDGEIDCGPLRYRGRPDCDPRSRAGCHPWRRAGSRVHRDEDPLRRDRMVGGCLAAADGLRKVHHLHDGWYPRLRQRLAQASRIAHTPARHDQGKSGPDQVAGDATAEPSRSAIVLAALSLSRHRAGDHPGRRWSPWPAALKVDPVQAPCNLTKDVPDAPAHYVTPNEI